MRNVLAVFEMLVRTAALPIALSNTRGTSSP